MTGEATGLFPVVPVMRVDDGEVGDSHIHHGPANGADIAGTLGFNEYDSDVFEWIHEDWKVGRVECWINGKLE